MSSAKNYTFTHYGPFEGVIALSSGLPEDLKYAIFQKEKCPETGREHIQGYVQFHRKCRGIAKLQKIIGNCHVEVARGTLDDNKKYCSKEESRIEGPWEVGTPTSQGERTDLERFKQAIKDKKSDRELTEEFFPLMLRHSRSVKKMRSLLLPPLKPKYGLHQFGMPTLNLDDKAVLLWGPTNTGKTNFALAHFNSPLLVRHLDELANFSTENDGIVFDDLEFNHCPFSQVMNLLDYEYDGQVHIRYETAIIPAKTKRIFTSNNEDPFYGEKMSVAQKEAIDRRIRKIQIEADLRLIESEDENSQHSVDI